MAYVRFVHPARCAKDGVPLGIFGPAYAVSADPSQTDYHRALVRSHIDWFEAQLPIPKVVRRRHSRRKIGVGLCWFRPEAQAHIARMHQLAHALDDIGIWIERIIAEDPGPIIFQDDYQVVAEAYAV